MECFFLAEKSSDGTSSRFHRMNNLGLTEDFLVSLFADVDVTGTNREVSKRKPK